MLPGCRCQTSWRVARSVLRRSRGLSFPSLHLLRSPSWQLALGGTILLYSGRRRDARYKSNWFTIAHIHLGSMHSPLDCLGESGSEQASGIAWFAMARSIVHWTQQHNNNTANINFVHEWTHTHTHSGILACNWIKPCRRTQTYSPNPLAWPIVCRPAGWLATEQTCIIGKAQLQSSGLIF